MRAPRTLLLATVLSVALVGCGSNDPDVVLGESNPGEAGELEGSLAETAEPESDELVVLEDDQGLQVVGNVVPVVQTEAATEPLREALDAVSEALTTEELVLLDRQVDDGQDPEQVAQGYAEGESLGAGVQGGQGTLVIGATSASQSQVVANLYAVALEGAGFTTEIRTFTDREAYLPALERGELTVVPESVGELAALLDARQNGPDAEPVASSDLDATVAALRPLAEQVGLTVLAPSEATDQDAFAVTRAFAEEHDLQTLSDLGDHAGELVLGGPADCPTRPTCQPGLGQTYGIAFDDVLSLDDGGPLTLGALRQGRIQVGLVSSADGALTSADE